MNRERYFDHAATTPVDERVLAEMLPFFDEAFGNANSIHSFGRRAADAVEIARQRVSELIGADDPSQVVFTSGATEANNWVVSAFENGAISPFEHDAAWEPAKYKGFDFLPNDGTSLLLPSQGYDLISVMGVNNEIGSIWRTADFRPYAQRLHSDLTQQAGKLSIDLADLDYASFSAHKLYGPKGVGALYISDEPPSPLMRGGEQEHGFRPGTLNVPGIVGFGAAAAIAGDEMEENFAHAQSLRAIVLEELNRTSDWRINGGENVSPYILSVSFQGIEGETLVVEADAAGYAISAGAACSSRSTEPSHVLTALGVEEDWRRGTVRISFGKANTLESANDLAKTLLRIVEKLRTM